MEITSFTLQLALLFVPGLIWTMLDAAHRPKKDTDQFLYLVRAFIFGVICYAVVGISYERLGKPFHILQVSAKNWSFSSSLSEFAWAVVTSVVLSVLWVAGRTHKIVTRTLNRFGVTYHIADNDICEFMFNSDNPKIKYAHVRDYENELIYAGYVRAFSEGEDVRELAMVEVIVYSQTGAELYSAPYLYLARSPSSITLEFPQAETDNGETGRLGFRRGLKWLQRVWRKFFSTAAYRQTQ